MSCGVDHKHGLKPELLRLWCRLAAAAPIRPLAREFPYAMGVALKREKKSQVDDSQTCAWTTDWTEVLWRQSRPPGLSGGGEFHFR